MHKLLKTKLVTKYVINTVDLEKMTSKVCVTKTEYKREVKTEE